MNIFGVKQESINPINIINNTKNKKVHTPRTIPKSDRKS